MSRDVLGERLDEERLADHDLVDRLAEQLGEARHVHALLGRVEVDRAGDLGGERLLVPFVANPDRLLHARSRRPGSSRAGSRAPRPGGRPSVRREGSPSGRTVARWTTSNAFPVSCRSPATTCEPRSPPSTASRGRLTRDEGHDERTARFLGMIETASEQMTVLLDELGARRADHGRPVRPGAPGRRHPRAGADRRRAGRGERRRRDRRDRGRDRAGGAARHSRSRRAAPRPGRARILVGRRSRAGAVAGHCRRDSDPHR